jgi:hypothetical protein
LFDHRSPRQFPQTWTWGDEEPPTANIPAADARKDRPAHFVAGQLVHMDRLQPLHRWEAGDRGQAAAYFVTLLKNGIPHVPATEIAKVPLRVWRFRGAPHYIEQQGERLRLTTQTVKRAVDNKELRWMAGLLSQLSERLVRVFNNGDVHLDPKEAEAVHSTFLQAEESIARLHLLAASSAHAVDEARAAYNLPPYARPFAVTCEFDPNLQTNGEVVEPSSPHASKPRKGDH